MFKAKTVEIKMKKKLHPSIKEKIVKSFFKFFFNKTNHKTIKNPARERDLKLV